MCSLYKYGLFSDIKLRTRLRRLHHSCNILPITFLYFNNAIENAIIILTR